MPRTFTRYLLLSILILVASDLLAQPTNDDCGGAIEITDLDNWCSDNGAFTLTNATASGITGSSCNGDQVFGDVWFSFVATKTVVTMIVDGNSDTDPGGTLEQPVVALYEGNCNGLSQLECAFDLQGSNVVQRTHPGLIPGVRYYIRVDSRSTNGLGSFQLCVNNFNPVAAPGQDCFLSALICDKSSFVVESVTGAGSDLTELDDATCVHSVATSGIEQQSTWFTWVADNDGTLEFELTPLNASDDLDFFLYELPNGRDNCAGKILLRCESAGLTAGIPVSEQIQCTGATGLRSGSVDVSEAPGCTEGQDNFLAPLVMETGKTYALAVNNYSESGVGFSVEFDGSGIFRGPDPAFNAAPTTQCLGEVIRFDDASTYADGDIVAWDWFFGENASVQSASGQGPHSVTFDQPGVQSVLLTVETSQGCIVTLEEAFMVDPCCQTLNAITALDMIQDAQCGDTNDGTISLAATSNYPPLEYRWEDASTGNSRVDLFAGDYRVSVTDQFCDTVFTYTIDAPPPITATTDIVAPNCKASDGSLTVNAAGGTPSYDFNINQTGYGANNVFDNLPNGTYEVIIRDQLGCDDTLNVDVLELQLELVEGENNVTMPTCNGFDDGRVSLSVNNGTGPFEFNFNNTGFQNESFVTGPAGTYVVDVRDVNQCDGQFIFEMTDHPAVELDLQKMDISCNGEIDGAGIAVLTGGVGNFTYAWSNGSTDDEITGLSAGFYDFVGADGNGCQIPGRIEIIEPAAIGIAIDEVEDVICFGDETGAITVSPVGGSGSFEYSIDGTNYFPVTNFGGLAAGDYTVYIRDVNDCISTNMATVDQPEELVVDVGPDQTIDLAFDATITSTYTPSNQIVSYAWMPDDEGGCGNCSSIRVTPFVTTDYILQITDDTGCTALDTVTIFVNDNRPVYIPNAISPDNDGNNDLLSIYANIAAVDIEELQVFDRWGEMLFAGQNLPLNDPTVGWDGTFRGKAVKSGVFVYVAKIRFIDDQVRIFKGDVVVLR